MTFNWTHGALAEGLHLYRAGDYFAAHEAWESVWLAAPQPEKTFLQGLIQTTVALHHFHRNNHLGATRLLTAALRKLEPYPPDFANIDVALLCDDIRSCLNSLAGSFTGIVIPSEAKNPRIHGATDPSAASAVPLAPPRIQPHSL